MHTTEHQTPSSLPWLPLNYLLSRSIVLPATFLYHKHLLSSCFSAQFWQWPWLAGLTKWRTYIMNKFNTMFSLRKQLQSVSDFFPFFPFFLMPSKSGANWDIKVETGERLWKAWKSRPVSKVMKATGSLGTGNRT